MNKSILIIILIFTTNLYSQNKKSIYVDDKQDYVILLDKNIKVSNRDIQGTEVDVFVKSSENKFNYTLLISKIFEHNFIKGNLLDDDYETYFLNTCGCSILERELIYYNNLKTLRYKIEAKKGDNTFIGYNDSFVNEGLLYNILFLTYEKGFDSQKQKYSEIMNTFIVNGKTTIDNYKEYEDVNGN
jgi:hypothetical protein